MEQPPSRAELRTGRYQPQENRHLELADDVAFVFGTERGQRVLEWLTREAQMPGLNTSEPDPHMAVGILFAGKLITKINAKIEQSKTDTRK